MPLKKISEILNKIEQPLLFAMREDYRRLPLIRDLGATLGSYAREISDTLRAFPSRVIHPRDVAALESLFLDYDGLSLPEKKDRLPKILQVLDALRQRLMTPQADAEDEALDLPAALKKISQPVQFVKGVGPKLARLLERKGILTVEDLLRYLPRRYEDRRHVKTISQLRIGERDTVVGRVLSSQLVQFRFRKTFEAAINDGTGVLTATWFKGNPAYLKTLFEKGREVVLTGEVRLYGGSKNMVHPDFEILEDHEDVSLHFRRIVPIYSETEGLGQKVLRRILRQALNDFGSCAVSPIPAAICERRGLVPEATCLEKLHFPDDSADLAQYNAGLTDGHRRMIYDEFFFFELGMAVRRQDRQQEKGLAFAKRGPLLQTFRDRLPYALTAAQGRVIDEILQDVARPIPMNRLLQGDVGSGKTVVAMAAMIHAYENGYQAAMMAPTEILADQHFRNVQAWSEPLGLKAALLTGSVKGAGKRSLQAAVASGEIDILVGTHALIQDTLAFANLGLAIIDEQHRFGVLQRGGLRDKGGKPHVLVMTATPIPRTLAMTVFGDLDVSVLDEMPPGKKPIKTKAYYEEQRPRVYEAIRAELRKKHQVFIVYPLVSESETLEIKDATQMHQHLAAEVFPEARIGLVHGQMAGREKDRVMSAFARRELDILVATTVIEVGIDIPSASLMVVEHAERFGLSQLHQLRGRVGRGDMAACCILLAQHTGSEDARQRLRIMEQYSDGFRIAEEDLALRGPGEFMGIRQSGLPEFRVANIVRDARLLGDARTDAFALIHSDPCLKRPEHAALKTALLHRWHGRLALAGIG